jgi:hypothetical protein
MAEQSCWKFMCEKKWKELTETDRSNVRFCAQCQTDVYLCGSMLEAEKHSNAGRCIALQEGIDLRVGTIEFSPYHARTLDSN